MRRRAAGRATAAPLARVRRRRGQEWRAQFYLWIEESVFSKELKYNPAHDEIVGKLLGYSNEDIRDFLKKKRGKSLSENDKS